MVPVKRRRRGCSSTGASCAPKNCVARASTASAERWVRWKYFTVLLAWGSRFLVVLDAQVGDLLLTHHVPQRVLELGVLDEEIVLGIHPRRHLRALEVEGAPLL